MGFYTGPGRISVGDAGGVITLERRAVAAAAAAELLTLSLAHTEILYREPHALERLARETRRGDGTTTPGDDDDVCVCVLYTTHSRASEAIYWGLSLSLSCSGTQSYIYIRFRLPLRGTAGERRNRLRM